VNSICQTEKLYFPFSSTATTAAFFTGFKLSENWNRYRERLHKNTCAGSIYPNKISVHLLNGICENLIKFLSQIACLLL